MPSAPLLDRAFLEKLERLTIHWQKSFAGLVGGARSKPETYLARASSTATAARELLEATFP